ncbi:MAG: hypothetical protein FWE10_08095 [Rikenellaceae bacterium]|nr:hypothetical protein [Rikenellaceae bacterium]MCL2692097.1 hypothetical protein [Rikenellaceae bacterium]
MDNNMFKGRMGRGGTFRTIDEMGITACDSNDPKVRAKAPCSNFGGEKKPAHHKAETHHRHETKHHHDAHHKPARATKVKEGLDAAVVYEYSIGGERDIPPLGHMEGINPAKPKTKKTAATAEKKTAARGCKMGSAAPKTTAKTIKPVTAKSAVKATAKSAAKPAVKKSGENFPEKMTMLL